ncbi:MAG: spondin domain-containing protein [Anaerolineales bacterium]|nr:spondin domain-containing protein [Anaerolineales bacterium]
MKPRTSRFAWALMALVLLLSLTATTAFAGGSARSYEVTITNLTDQGQPFTPPVVVTHQSNFRLFNAGRPASFALKEIAENGNLAPMLDALAANSRVSDVVVAVAGDPPPLMPGSSVTIEIEAGNRASLLSLVSMLICTNDGFTGASRIRLPRQVGQTNTAYGVGYDAGTEINTEDFANLVPPCPVLTGVQSNDPGTGTSDPSLAENGVVHMHGGILGIDDLDPAIHDWNDPVMMVSVTRVN